MDPGGQVWQANTEGETARSARGPVFVHVRDPDAPALELAGVAITAARGRVSAAGILRVAARLRRRLSDEKHGRGRHFNRDEEQFLKATLPRHAREFVADRFEVRFGWRPTRNKLQAYASRHGLTGAVPNTGRLKKGNVPPNKGVRGWGREVPNSGRFKKGLVPANVAPLYEERVRRRRGGTVEEIVVKVPQKCVYTDRDHRWIRKAAWVWRQAGRRVPNGMALVHLDGDPMNSALENLEVITRGALGILNSPWFLEKHGKTEEPTRIRLAQLAAAAAAKTSPQERRRRRRNAQ